ncbi:hypothetical protein I3760_14G033800 [Carya illinoinensis]|nr:hypothetical protein I3760_14G033800 [Carya illinoinensis]
MTSSSTNTGSSSWTSREKDKASVDRPLCYCGIPSKLRISGKSNSFGRRFYNCPNYKINKQCGFFEWIDLENEQNSCCKMTLELAQRRNERLFHEHRKKTIKPEKATHLTETGLKTRKSEIHATTIGSKYRSSSIFLP